MTISPTHPARVIVSALLLAAATPAVLAQDSYPSRMIRIVVPSAASGPTDTGARMIAQELSRRLGRQVIVENRAGAATIIGSELVAKAPADGYTLLMTPSTLATNPATYSKMPYDALRDFAPVTQTSYTPNVLAVHPSLPARSVKDLIALAKSRPAEITYASAGHGSNPHLTMELLASMAQIRLVHVSYKGGMPAIIDLLGGHVAIIATNMSALVPHTRSGRLRALGVTSARRVASAPDIPAIAEAGVPGYEAVQWYGLLVPAKTPRDIIDRLNHEVVSILRAPDVAARLAADGSEVVAGTPEAFAAFIRTETVKWAAVVRAAGITPE